MPKEVFQDVECEHCQGRGKVGRFVEVKEPPAGPPSKWDALTPAQQRHCQFMGYDPDNPDVPLD